MASAVGSLHTAIGLQGRFAIAELNRRPYRVVFLDHDLHWMHEKLRLTGLQPDALSDAGTRWRGILGDVLGWIGLNWARVGARQLVPVIRGF
jgi:hypothetical protein